MASAGGPGGGAPAQRVRVLVAAALAWVTLAAVFIKLSVPPALFQLGLFLTAICAGVALLAPFAGAELAAVVAAGALQSIASFALLAEGPRGSLGAGLGVAIAAAGIVVLTRLIVRRLRELDARLESDRYIIDELSQRDAVTGAVKRVHAERMLREEAGRARRYHSVFSVMIVGVDDWSVLVEHEGLRNAHERLRAIANIVERLVRSEDRLARHGEAEFALILAETPASGAEVLANRIIAEVLAETSTGVRAGISSFPDDSVDPDGLVSEAESALDFARAAGVGLASSRLLRG